MRLTKRGRLWRCDFTGLDGKRYRISTGEADERKAKIKALDIMREHMVDALPAEERRDLARAVTLDHALQTTFDERWKHQRQGKPLQYRVGQLQREVGHWRLTEITYSRLDQYVKDRQAAGDAPATINRKLSAIHTALQEAAKHRLIDAMPLFPHLKEAAIRERYLTRAEEDAVVQECWRRAGAVAEAERPAWTYTAHLVQFLVDTGLRLSEALGVTADNIVGTSVVLRHGTTKSGRGRQVPMTARAQACVRVLLGHPLHGKVDANWAGRRWRTITEHLGLEDATLHTLRHTCASRLVQAGMDLYRVKDWLGHSSITVTERYAHLAPTSLADGAAMLERGVPRSA